MTLTAIIFNDLYGTRAVLGISAGMAVAGYGVRWLLGSAVGTSIGCTSTSARRVVIVGSLESVSTHHRRVGRHRPRQHRRRLPVGVRLRARGGQGHPGPRLGGRRRRISTRRMQVDVVAVHDVDKLGGLQLAKLQWALEDVGTQMSIITPMTNTVVDRARVRTVGRRLIVDIAYSRPQGIVALIKGVVDRILALVGLARRAAGHRGRRGLLVKFTSHGSGHLQADPRPRARPHVHHVQAAHDGRGRRGPARRAARAQRGRRRAVQDEGRPACHPRRSLAAPAVARRTAAAVERRHRRHVADRAASGAAQRGRVVRPDRLGVGWP